jgi:hypothetical protein
MWHGICPRAAWSFAVSWQGHGMIACAVATQAISRVRLRQ